MAQRIEASYVFRWLIIARWPCAAERSEDLQRSTAASYGKAKSKGAQRPVFATKRSIWSSTRGAKIDLAKPDEAQQGAAGGGAKLAPDWYIIWPSGCEQVSHPKAWVKTVPLLQLSH